MNSIAIRATEDAAPRSSVPSALVRARKRAAVGCAAVAMGLLLTATSANAAEPSPWWHLDTSVRPAVIQEGGEATIVVNASNLGNACTVSEPGPDEKLCTEDDEAVVPSTLGLTLPTGTEVVKEEVEPGVFRPQVSLFAFSKQVGHQELSEGLFAGSFPYELCHLSANLLTCNTDFTIEPFPGFEFHGSAVPPLAPYEWIEMRVRVKDTDAEPGAAYEAEVSGGGAGSLTRSRALPLGSGATPFGAEEYSLVPEAQGGALDARAGAHPYQLTASFALNQNQESPNGGQMTVNAPAMPRNLHFRLPPGQIGNATALPRCKATDFSSIVEGGFENLCPADTAIGVAIVTFDEPRNVYLNTWPIPLFNLEPAFGEPARFGFEVAGGPVVLDTALRAGPGEDYGVTVTTANTTQLVNFISATTTFWGTPGDRSHDSARGWPCLVSGHWSTTGGRNLPCEAENQANPTAFLTLPTDCAAPFATTAEGDSWPYLDHPSQTLEPFSYSLEDGAGTPQPLIACNQVPFNPQIDSEPTSDSTTSPTGLSFDINVEDEGLGNPEGLAQSQIKKAVVTLPQGFTINPSVAEGLQACSEEEFDSSTLEGSQGCSQESKVGDVEIESPLVKPVIHGSIFVARQKQNPNENLLTLYMVARNPEVGVIVKQALKVEPDLLTGRLTTEVDNVPQLPFSHFHLFFRPGQRAPLVTPPACGTYTVQADLYPWARPTEAVHRESSFQITSGPEGHGCPSGATPPFHPGLEAGTNSNAAGKFSPFYVHMTRRDSEQEITHFSIKLPPGVAGILAGIPECSDGQIAAAEALETEGGGTLEEANPSCPAASQVGRSLVGSGVGDVLAYAPGKMYLAGPYHGSPLSLVSITAAKVGPFDLGTVVVRFALRIDPDTAEVFVDSQGSDPIPHIVDGIPVHLRDIRAYVDRPNFTFNPTGCDPTSTASTVLGSGLDFVSAADDVPVTVSSRFQAADCAALPFKPKLKLSLKGNMKRTGAPAFRAELTMKPGEANIGRSVVTLPSSEFLFNAHIQDACGIGQFRKTGSCPPGSVYGRVMAISPVFDEPLEGPVYLMSGLGHKLPDLFGVLKNRQVEIHLDGIVSSLQRKKNGEAISLIRNTFQSVPDAPVSKFVLEMDGGRKGLLQNSVNLCKGTNRAISEFTAHSGKVYDTKPVVKAASCKGGKKAGKRRGR